MYCTQPGPVHRIATRRTYLILVFSVLTCAASIVWGIKRSGLHRGDLLLYYQYANYVLAGRVPYRDYALEYPPVALVPMVLPRLMALGQPIRFEMYRNLFMLEFFGWLAVLLVVYRRSTHLLPPWVGLDWFVGLLGLAFLASSVLIPYRYDLFPALLTLLALLAALRQRPTAAGVWLGLGIAAKIYPVVLVPVLGLTYLAQRQFSALGRLAAGSVLTTALCFGGVSLLAGDGIGAFFSYHIQRPLQIESVPASVAVVAHLAQWSPVEVVWTFGSHNVLTAWDALLPGLSGLFVLAYAGFGAGLYTRFRQEYRRYGCIQSTTLAAGFVMALLLFLITNKVFSPQFLLWILPFVVFLRPNQVRLYTVIFALSAFLYPLFYYYVRTLNSIALISVVVRNVLVVILLVHLVVKEKLISFPTRRQSSTPAAGLTASVRD